MVGINIPRIQLYGLVKIRDGLVKLGFFIVDIPPIGVGINIRRIQLYGLCVV